MSNEQLLNRFYSSFQQKDYRTMIACYHPEIAFQDAVFTLQGKAAGAMWHMLCEQGKDLKLVFSGIQADERSGTAHWEAYYTFSATGRKVHNVIDGTFEFKDGLIVRHVDRFDFWRWSRQALGPAGMLLGWAPFLQKKVQQQAGERLEKFISRHPEYQP